MCNCLLVRMTAKKQSLYSIEKQVEECEACAYRNPNASNIKNKTYEVVRLTWVKKYWEQTTNREG